MPGRSHHAGGACPVRWLDRHALVTLPEHLEQSFATAVGEQLRTIIDDDVLRLTLTERHGDFLSIRPEDAAPRDRLGHVYWIGGGSGAGKSTIARRLAARHGLRLYATDEVMRDHARLPPGRARQPGLAV